MNRTVQEDGKKLAMGAKRSIVEIEFVVFSVSHWAAGQHSIFSILDKLRVVARSA
jgi:hypothetical protein